MRSCLVLLLCAAPTFAAETAIPVGSKTVTFDLPEGWAQSFEQATDKAFIRGYVPPETGSTEMITVTVSRNLAGLPDISTVDFVNFGLSALQAQCAGTFAREVVSPDYTVSGQPALGIFVSCTNRSGKPDGRSQELVMLAFRGTTDFYALQWIEDAAPLTETPVYDPARWQGRLDQLVSTARICDLTADEQTPCPPP